MSGKVQVTFAVSASAEQLPLGTPILVVFKGAQDCVRAVTLVCPTAGYDYFRGSWSWHAGALPSTMAAEIAATVGDAVYERLLMTEGFQDALPPSWPTS
jgi:hypothetical protein